MASSSLYGYLQSIQCPTYPRVNIGKSPFKIGRAYDSDLLVKDRLVSSEHCSISFTSSGEATLTDHNSDNGTAVSGRVLLCDETIALREGDVIHLVHSRKYPHRNVAFKLYILERDGISLADSAVPETTEASPEQKIADVPVVAEPAEVSSSETVTVGGDAGVSRNPEEEIRQSLLCSICQDSFHDPVTIQPCLHTFCAGCYSSWMTRSQACPACRKKVTHIGRNRLINSLLQSYLLMHPEHKKSADEVAQLEKMNTIKEDMAFPRQGLAHARGDGDDSDDSYYDDSDYDEDDDDEDWEWPDLSETDEEEERFPEREQFVLENYTTTADSLLNICSHCPGNGKTEATHSKQKRKHSQQSSASASASRFSCPAATSHILCQCCQRPMPDRRTDLSSEAQTCFMCGLEFCSLYFNKECGGHTGCKESLLPCLTRLKDVTIQKLCSEESTRHGPLFEFEEILMGNAYEFSIFIKWVQSQNKSDSLYTECLSLLDSGELYNSIPKSGQYFRTIAGDPVNSETPLCNECIAEVVEEIIYAYRLTRVPDSQLEAEYLNKPRCPHGRYCTKQENDSTVGHQHQTNCRHVCDARPLGHVFSLDESEWKTDGFEMELD